MIPDIEPVNNHYGNNVTTDFDFDFYIEDETQLTVTYTNYNGVQTELTYGVDYTIHELGNETGSYITFPIQGSSYSILGWNTSTDEKEMLSIALTLPFSQEAEYEMSKDLNKKNLEKCFDKLTRICQILRRGLTRAVKVQEGSNVDTDELSYNINTLADNISTIQAVNNNAANINAAAANETNITIIAEDISNINTIVADKNNIDNVALDLINIDTVVDNISDINTTAENISNINAIVSDITNVDLVANDLSNINVVGSNIESVTLCADSMDEIKNAPLNALIASNKAVEAAGSADNAQIWAEGTDAQVSALGGEHSSKIWAEQYSGGANRGLSNLSDAGQAILDGKVEYWQYDVCYIDLPDGISFSDGINNALYSIIYKDNSQSSTKEIGAVNDVNSNESLTGTTYEILS